MAKEIAISKISKISKAQQNMLLSVLIASLFLGAGLSLTIHFIQQISYNIKVIAEEEKSIANYTSAIQQTGICKAPKGATYSDGELQQCDPDNIEITEIPNTLRYNVLENLAANKALNSVPKEGNNNCLDSEGRNLTFKQLNDDYKNATSLESRQEAIQKIKTCSALRIVPDALPSKKNESALLASLNHIFNISNWNPKSFAPSGDDSDVTRSLPTGLNPIDVVFSIEADAGITMNVLSNTERSIREFDFNRATIEWSGDNNLNFEARATAYYADTSSLTETTTTINTGDN